MKAVLFETPKTIYVKFVIFSAIVCNTLGKISDLCSVPMHKILALTLKLH